MVSDLSEVLEPGSNRERIQAQVSQSPSSDYSGLWTKRGCQSHQDPRTHFARCTHRKAKVQRGRQPEGKLGTTIQGPEPKSQPVGSALATQSLRSPFLPRSPDIIFTSTCMGCRFLFVFLFFLFYCSSLWGEAGANDGSCSQLAPECLPG